MLITQLADQKEEWWVMVIDVGLDPELSKWSMRSGLAIVLTGVTHLNSLQAGKRHIFQEIPQQATYKE